MLIADAGLDTKGKAVAAALANSLPSMISAVAQFLGCLVMMFVTEWRMALAAIWPLPVAFAIVALASGVQKRLSSKAMAAKITCEDGIQECMETMPDLRANNAEASYLAGLEKKIGKIIPKLLTVRLLSSIIKNVQRVLYQVRTYHTTGTKRESGVSPERSGHCIRRVCFQNPIA